MLVLFEKVVKTEKSASKMFIFAINHESNYYSSSTYKKTTQLQLLKFEPFNRHVIFKLCYVHLFIYCKMYM